MQRVNHHSINIHASFFLDEDLICTSHLKLDGDTICLEMLYLAARCRGNLDLFMITLARQVSEGRFADGGSIVLQMMRGKL